LCDSHRSRPDQRVAENHGQKISDLYPSKMREDRFEPGDRPHPLSEHTIVVSPDDGSGVGHAIQLEIGFGIVADQKIKSRSQKNSASQQFPRSSQAFPLDAGLSQFLDDPA